MWITQLNNEAWLIEVNQVRVMANPPLAGTSREEFAQFFRAIKRPQVLIVRDFPESVDERLYQLAALFEWLPIFVVGGASGVRRLRERGLRRIYHLGAYQYFKYKGLRLMGVPALDESVAEGWVIDEGSATAWFQGQQSPSSKVACQMRVYLRRPLSVVIPPVPFTPWPVTTTAYQTWRQGILAARAELIGLPRRETYTAVKQEFQASELRLNLREFAPLERWEVSGRESELARHLSPLRWRRSAARRRPSSKDSVHAPVRTPPALSPEEQKRIITRLIEVQLHLEFLKAIYEETQSPVQDWIDRRAVMQIEMELDGGQVLIWHFARWYPRCEIGYGPHPQPQKVFRYRAAEVLPYVTGVNGRLPSFTWGDAADTWHPLRLLKNVWRDSWSSPLLADCELDRLMYRI